MKNFWYFDRLLQVDKLIGEAIVTGLKIWGYILVRRFLVEGGNFQV